MTNSISFVVRTGIALSLLFSFSSCVSTSGSTDAYYGAWYDAFGNVCGSSPFPGCDYYADGMKIMIYQDPFYFSQLGNNSGSGLWMSPDGIIYDFTGFALNDSTANDNESRDVLTAASEREKSFVQTIGKIFADRYALNETTSVKLASSLRDWAILAKDRSRTMDDTKVYLTRLYGIQADQAFDVLNQSASSDQKSALQALNVDIAANWGTTPEVSAKILKAWYAKDASQLGF